MFEIQKIAYFKIVTIGGYKIYISTANIPKFHSRYRRYVLITNKFDEFC
jgi:hypothetical protein